MSAPADRRLGYLISQYPAVTHTFILREIRLLRNLGRDIRVVSIRQPDRRAAALSADEAEELQFTSFVLGSGTLPILTMHARVFFRRPLRYFSTLLYALTLANGDLRATLQHLFYFAEAVIAGYRLQAEGIEHAHTHFASTVMLLVSHLFPISFSMTIHGPDEFNDTEAFHMANKVTAANLVATISQFASSQVMRASDPVHWHKIRAFPLGVDPHVFIPRPIPAKFEILCVGRLAPVKAHLLLVGAIQRLVSQGRKNFQLVLVGDGPSRPVIEDEIARLNLHDYICVEGAQNHDRVIEYYRRASVFALASFAEGVPVVLMEAMAMEVPCIATWVAGIPELIRDGVDGLLVPPADEDAIASAILRLMDDPEFSARLAKSGRLRVVEKYNLAKNVRRLDGALRDLDR